MTCSKCLTENPIQEKYAYLEGSELKQVHLCSKCNSVYSQNLLPEFMKEDFGSFPINRIDRDIINARIKRQKGESPWTKPQS